MGKTEMFDTTINIGALLQIAAMLGGGLYFLWKIQTQLEILNNTQMSFSKKIEKIDRELEELAKVTIEIARQDERMNAQDIRLQELSIRLESHLKREPSSFSRRKKG